MELTKKLEQHYSKQVVEMMMEDITEVVSKEAEVIDGESQDLEALCFNGVKVEFKVIEHFDDEEEEYTEELEYILHQDFIQDTHDLLKEKGIKYEKSNQSSSFYLQLEDGEHRVSDHRRPMVEGIYKWEYEHEHIVENEEDIYWTIQELIK